MSRARFNTAMKKKKRENKYLHALASLSVAPTNPPRRDLRPEHHDSTKNRTRRNGDATDEIFHDRLNWFVSLLIF